MAQLDSPLEVPQRPRPSASFAPRTGSSSRSPTNIQQVAASQLALTNLYYENVLSQAKRSFNAATVAAAAGLVFFLAAISGRPRDR